MPGRAAARRASARIRVALNAAFKPEPEDESLEKDSAYELEEDQTELDKGPATDSSTRQDSNEEPYNAQDGEDSNRKCTKCDRPSKRLRREMCGPCYRRLFLKPKNQSNKRVCVECKQLRPHCAKEMCANCYSRILRKTIKCRLCGEVKKHNGRGLCRACYRRKHPQSKEVECKSCGETKKHTARGLCDACYQREHPNRKKVKCECCGQRKIHEARGLCRSCYTSVGGKMIECKLCGQVKRHAGRGLCKACYKREHPNRKTVECNSCRQLKRHKAHGLCKGCYSRGRGKTIECTSCGRMKKHAARGLCVPCYDREQRPNKTTKTRKRPKSGPSSNAAIQRTSNDDTITLSSASEDETDAVVSSGEEGESYDVKPRVKKEEPVMNSGDEAPLKREVDSSSSDDDEEETSNGESIKQEIKQEN